jgi:hypothetical protein
MALWTERALGKHPADVRFAGPAEAKRNARARKRPRIGLSGGAVSAHPMN